MSTANAEELPVMFEEEAGEIMLGSVQALISVLALLVGIGNVIWTWISKSQSAAADRVKKIEEEQDALDIRLIKLEAEFQHLPTKEDVSALRLQIETLSGMLKQQASEIGSVSRTVRRIDDYLREKA